MINIACAGQVQPSLKAASTVNQWRMELGNFIESQTKDQQIIAAEVQLWKRAASVTYLVWPSTEYLPSISQPVTSRWPSCPSHFTHEKSKENGLRIYKLTCLRIYRLMGGGAKMKSLTDGVFSRKHWWEPVQAIPVALDSDLSWSWCGKAGGSSNPTGVWETKKSEITTSTTYCRWVAEMKTGGKGKDARGWGKAEDAGV